MTARSAIWLALSHGKRRKGGGSDDAAKPRLRAWSEVTDAEWAIVDPLLHFPRQADGRGRPPAETQAVINGCCGFCAPRRRGGNCRRNIRRTKRRTDASSNGWAAGNEKSVARVGREVTLYLTQSLMNLPPVRKSELSPRWPDHWKLRQATRVAANKIQPRSIRRT